jgi:hypothetical protein
MDVLLGIEERLAELHKAWLMDSPATVQKDHNLAPVADHNKVMQTKAAEPLSHKQWLHAVIFEELQIKWGHSFNKLKSKSYLAYKFSLDVMNTRIFANYRLVRPIRSLKKILKDFITRYFPTL